MILMHPKSEIICGTLLLILKFFFLIAFAFFGISYLLLIDVSIIIALPNIAIIIFARRSTNHCCRTRAIAVERAYSKQTVKKCTKAIEKIKLRVKDRQENYRQCKVGRAINTWETIEKSLILLYESF